LTFSRSDYIIIVLWRVERIRSVRCTDHLVFDQPFNLARS
jgi:hypothetical protein